MQLRPFIWIAALGVATSALGAAPAEAQAPYPAGAGAYGTAAYGAEPARDDVQWEERRTPYDGGPIRPGGQLEGSINGWTWVGALGFVGGAVLGAAVAITNDRAYGAIPLVGPWLAIANAGSDTLQWDAGPVAGMVIAGILQPVGLVVFVAALLTPNLWVVHDAPVGAPSTGYVRLRLAPFAPGAELGASLTLEAF